VQEADITMMLIPDEVMPEVFKSQVAPNLKKGAALSFASGYTIGFELIQPPAGFDVFMIAPRMIGPGVRDTYIQGTGFPSFVAVHQDATGSAEPLMLAVAKGLGTLKAGALLMSMRMEAELDLFSEQAFSPAFGRVLMAAIETEIKAGYPVEAVLLELLMSGELIYSLEKIVEVGLIEQMRFHSQTSQYGTMTRSFNYLDLPLEEKMEKTLDDIRSGAFTREWQEEQRTGMKNFHALDEVRKQLPISEWQRKTRAVFRNIGKNMKKA
jgi:ketol-acid reductoisomerase